MDFVRVKPKGNIPGALLIKRMLGALMTGLI